jgi:hypothetical protein
MKVLSPIFYHGPLESSRSLKPVWVRGKLALHGRFLSFNPIYSFSLNPDMGLMF